MRWKVINFLVVLIFFTACKNILPSKKYEEGVIVFKINYLTPREENPIVVIMPKEMIVYFADNNTLTTMQGFFGTFKFDILSRYDLKKKYAILKIFDKRYVYETDYEGDPVGFDEIKNIKIKLIDTTFDYKNLTCHLAKAYCKAISPDTFEIYYTFDIDIADPNANTPFEKIPGVIVKTKMKLMGIAFELELQEIKPERINSNIFELPKENLRFITKQEMEKILNDFKND